MKQQTPAPTRKITAAGAGVVVGTFVVEILSWGLSFEDITLPTAVASATTGLIALVAGYMTEETEGGQ